MNPLKKNHFALFGLPERFDVDVAALDGAWRSVQAAVHPDRHVGAASGDADRRVAMQLAAQANDAYATLRDPARRGAYLCTLNGVDPQAESNTSMSPQFLTAQIDWRERLDEARTARDAAAVASLRSEVSGSRTRIHDALRATIDERREFHAAAGLVRQLMFVERFAEELDAVEAQLSHD